MTLEGEATVLEVACVSTLPYAALLGRDVPAFRRLLHQATRVEQNCVGDETDGDRDDREASGTSDDTDPGEGPSEHPSDAGTWLQDPAFQAAQEADETLRPARDGVAVSEGRVLDTRRAARLPRFEKTGGVWERVTRDPRERGEVTHIERRSSGLPMNTPGRDT